MGAIKKWSKETVRDITSLGGFAIYWLVIFLFLAMMQWNLVLRLLFAFGITVAVAYVIRLFYYRDRPKKESYKSHLEKMDASSFPSLHTLRSAAFAVVLIPFFNNLLVSILLITYAILVGFTRIGLKKHHFSDVLFGWIVGFLIGYKLG